MGTTVWISDETREKLRDLQSRLGAKSANETIERLLDQPAEHAASMFRRHAREISACMKRHGVSKLMAFGSRASGTARPDSDLDLAVLLRPTAGPLALLAFEGDMEAMLGVPVHAVTLPAPRLQKALSAAVPFVP